jgi:U3 small nucleolar RNA-associated protein 23
MRAKRSKRYRKIMSAYQLAFSFREPYQILLDAAFIRTCHAFHMPLQKYLENTLHGPCRIFVTQCTLAKITKDYERETKNKGRGRPEFLPPPTELPLRYCKHKNDEGEDLGVVDEWRCLLDLLAGQPKGNEQAKNKQHYILATADPPEEEQRKKAYINVRERARLVPGVPIIYVKRSVMILEELSAASEAAKRGAEKEKFREGLIGNRKRKRRSQGEDEMLKELMQDEPQQFPIERLQKRAKGPNPLSVQKKKVKIAHPDTLQSRSEEEVRSKTSRRGKRGKKKSNDDSATMTEVTAGEGGEE